MVAFAFAAKLANEPKTDCSIPKCEKERVIQSKNKA